MAQSLNNTLNSRPKLLVAFVVSLALSYLFISLAIDSGSYWHYGPSLGFLWLGVKASIRAVKHHGEK